MTANLILTFAALLPGQSPTWRDIVQPEFKDARFEAVAVTGSQRELQKINSDFAQSYRFKTTTAWLKEPFMIRMESVVEDAKVIFIQNGWKKSYKLGRAPAIAVSIAGAPGKRQTVFDFGMLTPSLFDNFMVATFVRSDRETGDLVFDITYQKSFDDTSRHRIWVDKAHHYVKRRTWFNQEGGQMATFAYESPKNEDGVWFPTKCTVRNNENKIAGVTEYRKMSINPGLDGSLFKI